MYSNTESLKNEIVNLTKSEGLDKPCFKKNAELYHRVI